METTTLTVQGMTCGHCVSAVKEEIGAIAGVAEVQVDLVEGGDSPVTVTSESQLNREDLAAAVDEAGYTLV
ncbi:heavy-metal-associated domain-containing protein [Brevibacterium yomogidense]|uniref:heavy-metal-associated domain-containing protein n=1 Tax=Brevibacterium yomogidense TaxID=946573 RepID=UPI0018DFC3B6|nr:cation transporter [Brevibacterium yomogidense]